MKLNLDQAEKFVSSHKNASWNGWTIELFHKQDNAFMRTDGAIKDGVWGTLLKVAPDNNGMYSVPKSYIRG